MFNIVMLEFVLFLDILDKDIKNEININKFDFEYSDDEIKF